MKTNATAISRPKIIIAAKHQLSRTRLAKALVEMGCAVETTDSAACLMENLLRCGASVVVLGDGLEEGLSVATLIPLLKSCSPHSTIILIADDVSITEERKVSQQGIFYRASRPVCALGWEELQLAVDCARSKVMHAVMPAHLHYKQSSV